MLKTMRENPLTTGASAIGAIATILGALWAFDGHYATAADLQQTQQTFTQQVTQMREDAIDDKIFELQLKQNQQKGKLSPIDAALLDRYQRKLQELQTQLKASPTPVPAQ